MQSVVRRVRSTTSRNLGYRDAEMQRRGASRIAFQETRWGWRVRRSIVDVVVFPQPATVLLTLRPGYRCCRRRRLRCRRLSIVGCRLSMLEGRGGPPERRGRVFSLAFVCVSLLCCRMALNPTPLPPWQPCTVTTKLQNLERSCPLIHFSLLQQKKKGRWNPKLVSSCVASSLSLQATSFRMGSFLECDQPLRISRHCHCAVVGMNEPDFSFAVLSWSLIASRQRHPANRSTTWKKPRRGRSDGSLPPFRCGTRFRQPLSIHSVPSRWGLFI